MNDDLLERIDAQVREEIATGLESMVNGAHWLAFRFRQRAEQLQDEEAGVASLYFSSAGVQFQRAADFMRSGATCCKLGATGCKRHGSSSTIECEPPRSADTTAQA